jgi:N utilization substance protein A
MKVYDDRVWLVINDEDYPTVIGKKGMNARLIGQLIGREIDVQKISEYHKLLTIQMAELAESTDPSLDEKLKIAGISGLILESLIGAGFDTLRHFMQAVPTDLQSKVPGVNYYDLADKILEQIRKKKG